MLRLAYFVELTWLLVDMFSGYLQNHNIFLPGNLTVSALLRLAVVALFVLILLQHTRFMGLPYLILLLMCVAWTSIHTISSIIDGEINLLEDTQFHLKLMLPVLIYGVFQAQMMHGVLQLNEIHRIIALNGSVLITNLLLGIFGIGFGNYGESSSGEQIGSKGFFYAGNEVSAALVAIFALVMFFYRRKFLTHPLLLLSVVGVFFIASLMSLSKTSLLGFLLVLLFVTHNFLSFSQKVKFFIILSFAILITLPYWLPILEISIERWQYFWELRPDFLDFITSGRSERVEIYFDWLTQANTPLPWIIGDGSTQSKIIGSFENDFLDLSMNSGLLGLIFYGIWIGWAASGLSAHSKNHRQEGIFTMYIIGIFLILSIVAGHVIYSATLAPFIALLALTSSRHFPGNTTDMSNNSSQA